MNLGTECQNWLRTFMTNCNICMQRTKIPKIWRRAKIIAILKPCKTQSPEEAGSYRPISLLSVCFKLLERLIYNNLLPVVDPQLPREQAGIRPSKALRSCICRPISSLRHSVAQRSSPEDAATNTKQTYMVRFIRELITHRGFKLYVGKDSSKTYTIKNDVPQGSVLATMLFNVYIHMTFRKLHQQNICMLMILL